MNTDICLPGVPGLRPGFSDPVMESQGTFRTVLNAMINPGRVLSAGGSLKAPEPLHPAAAAVCLTLLDFETPLWVDLPGGSESMRWLQFHCGCPLIPHPSAAKFALITNWTDAPSLGEFYIGKDESPGSSATLILQVSGLTSGSGPAPYRSRYRNRILPGRGWAVRPFLDLLESQSPALSFGRRHYLYCRRRPGSAPEDDRGRVRRRVPCT